MTEKKFHRSFYLIDPGQGIWIDGRLNQEELDKLIRVQTEVVRNFRNLPEDPQKAWEYKDDKLTFRAWRKGGTLMVFYGWNYPPSTFWIKEIQGSEECQKCFPEGLGQQPIGREVWCEKMDYNFPQCPYGVPTPRGTPCFITT